MKLEDIQQIANNISEKYGYPKIIIEFNNKVGLGECDTTNTKITLNKRKCEVHSEKYVTNLLKHEFAHIKHPNHSTEFVRECQRMGTQREFWFDHVNTYKTAPHTIQGIKLKSTNKTFKTTGFNIKDMFKSNQDISDEIYDLQQKLKGEEIIQNVEKLQKKTKKKWWKLF